MKTVGPDDLVCRYGGEEFTVLMPHTTLDEAEMKAEKCRLAVKTLEFPKLKITVSLGVSALCQNPETPQDLLDQADKCLYMAKRNGRNQVVRWTKPRLRLPILPKKQRRLVKKKKRIRAAVSHTLPRRRCTDIGAGAPRPDDCRTQSSCRGHVRCYRRRPAIAA